MSKDRFKKYGQHFDGERTSPDSEPESPYESAAYIPPDKRPQPIEIEKEELAELRGGKKSHWD